MITKEELERIKQGDGLVVESNGIKHYGASEVLINGHSLTKVLEAAAAYKEEQSIDHQKPETSQDVIADLRKEMLSQEFGHIIRVPAEIINRLEAIAKRMGGDGESKADEPVEIPKQKTCPHCGSSHVITTKVITIGEGQYSEAETDLCLTCGRDLVCDSNE